MKRIYLAGPGVFLPDPFDYFAKKKDICSRNNLEGVSPLDGEGDFGYRPSIERGLMFSKSNEKIMNSCEAIFADMTPFRGISADVGTAFEMGYMRGKGKKIFAYSNNSKTYLERFKEKHPNDVIELLNGRYVDNDAMSIENFYMNDNLMLHGPLIIEGTAMFVGDVKQDDLYTSLDIFTKLVEFAAPVINGVAR